MTEINYMTQGKVEMPKLNEPVVLDWIVAVAATLNQKVGCLTYVFCDDDYILETNRQFLGHDFYTDIITFDYTNSRHIAGDMVISLHGVLHLCGINDKGPGEREIMEQHENAALSILPKNVFLDND